MERREGKEGQVEDIVVTVTTSLFARQTVKTEGIRSIALLVAN